MFNPKRVFPEDERTKAAQELADREIEKLNKLLVAHGFPAVSRLERPTLVTYIKARELGLLGE